MEIVDDTDDFVFFDHTEIRPPRHTDDTATGSCKPMTRTADSLSTTLSSLPSVHHRPINIFRSKVSPNR